MKLPTWTYLVVFIGGAFLMWYLLRGCDGRNIDEIKSQLDVSNKKNDSLLHHGDSISALNNSLKEKNRNDSIKFVTKIDSQSTVIKSLQGKYYSSQNKVVDLTKQLRTYYLSKDTVQLFKTYDSLKNELTVLNNAYFAVQINRDSLDFYYKGELERLHTVINETQSQLDEFKKIFTAEVLNNKNLTTQIEKSIRKERIAKVWGNIQKGLAVIAGFFIGKGVK